MVPYAIIRYHTIALARGAAACNRFGPILPMHPLREAPETKLSVMSLLETLRRVFELPPAPPASTETDRERLARSVVAERSHGNILLQQGKYYTKEDLEAECEQVRRYDFRQGSTGGGRRGDRRIV